MAITRASKQPSKPKRKVVSGIEHGLGGYTNYECRCTICTKANSQQSREYRDRRYAGNPLCKVAKCPRQASRAFGNGLCYFHAEQLKLMRQRKEAEKQRDELARRRRAKARSGRRTRKAAA